MSRPVRSEPCPHCGTKVLRGVDDDTVGIPTAVDRDPVDNLGEAMAVLTGRRTFDLIPCRGSRGGIVGSELHIRTGYRIAHPSPLRRPVHAEHRCGAPLPPAPATEAVEPAWAQETAF